MRGTIEARVEGQWRIRAYAGRENGKVRWVSRTVHGGKRTAADRTGEARGRGRERPSRRVAPGHFRRVGREVAMRHSPTPDPPHNEGVPADRGRKRQARTREHPGQQVHPPPDRRLRSSLTARPVPASVRRHHALLHAALGVRSSGAWSPPTRWTGRHHPAPSGRPSTPRP